MKSVEELKDLTIEIDGHIPDVAEQIAGITYHVESGVCYGFNLYNDGDIAVQRAFLSKGTKFPMHRHIGKKEHLLFYKGKGIAIVEGQENIILEEGDCILVQERVYHGWEILEDSWVIGTTVPADEAYPK